MKILLDIPLGNPISPISGTVVLISLALVVAVIGICWLIGKKK